MQGWIKLHRKIIESIAFENEKCLKVWIWCLAKATHKDTVLIIGRQKLNIKIGQFIMGGIKAEETLKIARSTIYYWLSFLESEGQIDIKKTNKYTIITIKNWEKYQILDIKSTSNVTTDEHQIDTYKNNKNNKEEDMLSKRKPKIKKTIQDLQETGDIKLADNYQADGMSPRQVLMAKKAIERSLGLGRSTKWTQLLFGAGHDFAKIYKAKVGHPYIGGIILDEIAKRLAEYYEAGETRETMRQMLSDFFESRKAEEIGRTPNIAFSEHTYNLWKDNKLKPPKEAKKIYEV